MTLPTPFPETDDIYKTNNQAFILFGNRFLRTKLYRVIIRIFVGVFLSKWLGQQGRSHRLCHHYKS